MPQSTRLMDVP